MTFIRINVMFLRRKIMTFIRINVMFLRVIGG